MLSQSLPVIGLDFDNTLAAYDSSLHRAALERGLISSDLSESKLEIRTAVRGLPNGEIEWQKLQGMVYGPRMGEAELAEGVIPFFQICQRLGVEIYIVSHKTKYANYDETRTNLRSSAMDWMKRNNFFGENGLGVAPANVHFLSTRQEKLHRIKELGCSHFVDDLEEVFSEQEFPKDVKKILYAPKWDGSNLPGVTVATSWACVSTYILDD